MFKIKKGHVNYSKYTISDTGKLQREWRDLLKSENAQHQVKTIKQIAEKRKNK